jgi:hypothetical protein
MTKSGLDISKILDKVESSLKAKHMGAALESAGRVVVNKAVQLVPRSEQTGTREGNSKEYKRKYGDPPKPLHQTIGLVGRSYKQGQVHFVAVGAERPAGAHGHLVENGHKMVLWGRGYKASVQEVQRTNEVLKVLRATQDGRRGRRFSQSIQVKTVLGGVQGFVQAKKWLAPAGDSTRPQQEQAVISVLSSAMDMESKSA